LLVTNVFIFLKNFLEELEHGNDSVLSAIPEVISVCTNIPQEISEDSQYLNSEKKIFLLLKIKL